MVSPQVADPQMAIVLFILFTSFGPLIFLLICRHKLADTNLQKSEIFFEIFRIFRNNFLFKLHTNSLEKSIIRFKSVCLQFNVLQLGV
jgi:hypothetical protein